MRESIEQTLTAHQRRFTGSRGVERCACGESTMGQPSWHRVYLAAVLADLIDREATFRAVLMADACSAAAWDEGAKATADRWDVAPASPNPYRQETS